MVVLYLFIWLLVCFVFVFIVLSCIFCFPLEMSSRTSCRFYLYEHKFLKDLLVPDEMLFFPAFIVEIGKKKKSSSSEVLVLWGQMYDKCCLFACIT